MPKEGPALFGVLFYNEGGENGRLEPASPIPLQHLNLARGDPQ